MTSRIVDIEPLSLVEELAPGWQLWEVEAVLEDGGVIRGVCQGDGAWDWAHDTFEEGDSF